MTVSDPVDRARKGSLYSPLVEAAARLAARGHYHQFRKRPPGEPDCNYEAALPATCIPYVTHLMGAAIILARLGVADEVIAAALLHDYLEDVPDPDGAESIRHAVGDEVLGLVRLLTEDKRREQTAATTWELRKQEQIDHIEKMPSDAVLIKLADILHNLCSLLTELRLTNEPRLVWQKFNAGPERQMWYFRSVRAAAFRRLGDHQLVRDVDQAIAELATVT